MTRIFLILLIIATMCEARGARSVPHRPRPRAAARAPTFRPYNDNHSPWRSGAYRSPGQSRSPFFEYRTPKR